MAASINELGQVAGLAYTNSVPNETTGMPTLAPFLWEYGVMKDLGTLGGVMGYPNWLNNRGEVAGTSDLVGDVNFHGFLWDGRSLRDLRTLGGKNSEAFWVSDSGVVVGRADISMQSTNHHAFLWNGAMTDLGTIAPWPCSTANSVNSEGQVVGSTGICGGEGGPSFFSERGQPMVDINTLIITESDLEVVDAYEINDCGVIAGAAVLPNGDVHAVVLIPASAEEIAAANPLNESRPTSTSARRLVRNSESSKSQRLWGRQ